MTLFDKQQITASAKHAELEDVASRLGKTVASFVHPHGHVTSPLMGVHAEFQRRLRTQHQMFMEPLEEAGHLTKEAEFFKTSLCSFYSKGKPCPKGRACTYAHGVHELRTFKTALCKEYINGGICPRGDMCTFAHGEGELRYRGDLVMTVAKVAQGGVSRFHNAIDIVKSLHTDTRTNLRDAMLRILQSNGSSMHVDDMCDAINLQLMCGDVVLLDDFPINAEVVLVFSILFSGVFLTDLQTGWIGLTSHLSKNHDNSNNNAHCNTNCSPISNNINTMHGHNNHSMSPTSTSSSGNSSPLSQHLVPINYLSNNNFNNSIATYNTNTGSSMSHGQFMDMFGDADKSQSMGKAASSAASFSDLGSSCSFMAASHNNFRTTFPLMTATGSRYL